MPYQELSAFNRSALTSAWEKLASIDVRARVSTSLQTRIGPVNLCSLI